MNDGSWNSVIYKESDMDMVIEFIKKYYGDSEVSTKEFFVWQHEKSPAGSAVIRLAKNDLGKVVGFYCVIPQWFKIGGKKVKGSVSVNTLVDDEYRGRGIFTKLANDCYEDCIKRDISFTIGFPNQNSYSGFVKKLDFNELPELPLLIYPLSFEGLIIKKIGNNMVGKLASYFGTGLDRLWRNNVTESVNVKEVSELNEDFVKFSHVIDKQFNNATVRDRFFIKWRTGLPHREYKILCYFEKKEILGYVILRTKVQDNIKSGFMVDFVIADKYRFSEIGKELLKGAIFYFKKEMVELIGCLVVENSLEYKIMRKYGFVACPKILRPQPFKVITKWHIGKVPKNFNDPINWFLTMIDYDVG